MKKRLVKAPRLYFYDVGLACYLLGVRSAEQLERHPLRGALFENLVVADVMKARCNAAKPSNLFFYREHAGIEIDLVLEEALARYRAGPVLDRHVVYGGDEELGVQGAQVHPWRWLGETTF